MQFSGPESRWTRIWSPARLLPLLCALALVLALALTPSAGAQEVPGDPGASDVGTGPAPPDAAQNDPAPPPETTPEPLPAADPEPPPPGDPPPAPPESQQPADTAVVPVEEHAQPAPDRAAPQRDATNRPAPPAPQPASTSLIAAAPPSAAPVPSPDIALATPEPLGWDLYDDALFADTLDRDPAPAATPAGGPPVAVRGLITIRAAGAAVERDPRHAKPVSRAEPKSGGGSGPGGPGPAQGPSLGLLGGGGGSAAGIALLTLLGMACGWFLLAPDRTRAFLAPTATWRPSAYVPPIEHPG